MEIKLPYEIVRKAVDAAADPSNPGVWMSFTIWMNDGREINVCIERPKNIAAEDTNIKIAASHPESRSLENEST